MIDVKSSGVHPIWTAITDGVLGLKRSLVTGINCTIRLLTSGIVQETEKLRGTSDRTNVALFHLNFRYHIETIHVLET